MKSLRFLVFFAIAFLASSCHDVPEWPDDNLGNFDALWSIIDEHYGLFADKEVDWNEIRAKYRPEAAKCKNSLDLYAVCATMLDELRDGHVNLTAPWATSYYKKWWSDYPQNYDNRLVEEYYLHFSQLTRNGLSYYILPDNIAYIRYPSFSYSPGEGTLDWALALLRDCDGLIIDIRDNGGGDLSNVEMIVRRFIAHPITAGYIVHKTGPAHDAFSTPYPIVYNPADAKRITWDATKKPVVVLTNRSTFSAANNFAAVMRSIPGVTLVGDTTGGGSGMPFSSEIPCGWSLRFSSSVIYDSTMRLTENGVEPHIHIDLDPQLALQGIDTMLERAMQIISDR